MGASRCLSTDTYARMSAAMRLVLLALAMLAVAEAAKAKAGVGIDTAELKDAMDEAEDVDEALDWTNSALKKWGGDKAHQRKVLKGMPPIQLKDTGGINLAGARDIMGKKNDAAAISESEELKALAKAENRLAAAKEDVEAAAAGSPVKRAQLEDLAQELTEEAAKQLD